MQPSGHPFYMIAFLYSKQFICTALAKDFIYAKELGYKIICLNLYYWPNGSKFPTLTKHANYLLNLIQSASSNTLLRKIFKRIYLTAIGRFALNLQKESKVESTVSAQKLFLSINKRQCNSFEILGDSVIMDNNQNINFSSCCH